MIAKHVTERMRYYTQTYGKDATKWPLAVKFQTLFELVPLLYGQKPYDSVFAGKVYSIVSELAHTENSGITVKKSKIDDHHWEDTLEVIYTFGTYLLKFTACSNYRRGRVDTDWGLEVYSEGLMLPRKLRLK